MAHGRHSVTFAARGFVLVLSHPHGRVHEGMKRQEDGGGLCGPSQCPTVAQPFPQRHVCHSLTRELGRAQISTAQPFLGEAEPGPDGCRLPLGWLSGADHPCFSGPAMLSLFRLLPAVAEHRRSGLSPAALVTQDSSHGCAIDQVTPPAQAAPAAASSQLVPSGSCRLLPRRPSPLCLQPARRRPEGPGPAREIRSSQPPAVFIRN